MTLAFSTKFPKGKPGLEGKPTHFIEKIWTGIVNEESLDFNISHYEEFHDAHVSLFGSDFGYNETMIIPKIHTMRSDEKDRWKKDNNIHFVINNRQPNRFQFAPVIRCSGIEHVKIEWQCENGNMKKSVRVYIGSKNIGCMIWNKGFEDQPIATGKQMIELAENDGFDSIEEFFMWFNEDWSGKIIHWTSLRYVPEAIEVNEPEVITLNGKNR